MTVSNGKLPYTRAAFVIHTNVHYPKEPGYYADGQFGIRIESIVLVREVKTPNNFGDVGYLGFEHVTLVSSNHATLCMVTDVVSTMPVSHPEEARRCGTDNGAGTYLAE
jgi:hypothetical protein